MACALPGLRRLLPCGVDGPSDRGVLVLVLRPGPDDGLPAGAHRRRHPGGPGALPHRGLAAARHPGFLDDLFVDPAHRGSGAVDALFAELRRIGEQQGWPTLAWRTAENNYRARSVYDRYATTTGFLTYSMSLGA
ncbi:GNAT family N-acetyltransferase [Streptacidiphilus monticola]